MHRHLLFFNERRRDPELLREEEVAPWETSFIPLMIWSLQVFSLYYPTHIDMKENTLFINRTKCRNKNFKNIWTSWFYSFKAEGLYLPRENHWLEICKPNQGRGWWISQVFCVTKSFLPQKIIHTVLKLKTNFIQEPIEPQEKKGKMQEKNRNVMYLTKCTLD